MLAIIIIMVVGFLSGGVGKRENREGGNKNEGKRGGAKLCCNCDKLGLMFFCGLVATWRRLQAAWQAQPVLVRVTLAVEHGVVPLLCAVLIVQQHQSWKYDSWWENLLGWFGFSVVYPLLAFQGWFFLGLVSLQLACVLWCWLAKRPLRGFLLYLASLWGLRFILVLYMLWAFTQVDLD